MFLAGTKGRNYHTGRLHVQKFFFQKVQNGLYLKTDDTDNRLNYNYVQCYFKSSMDSMTGRVSNQSGFIVLDQSEKIKLKRIFVFSDFNQTPLSKSLDIKLHFFSVF